MENIFTEAAKRAVTFFSRSKPTDNGVVNYSQPQASYFRVPGSTGYGSGYGGMYYNRWSLQVYDGEKTLGNAGPIVERIPDQQALRIRGWEAYLTNDTVQAVVNKSVKWIVGRGLKLQAIIDINVLESEGIKVTREEAQKLSDLIEARFNLYADDTMSAYSGMKSLNFDEQAVLKNIYNGGDILVVLRYVKGQVKYQLIDGAHVRSPQGGTDFNPQLLENGNRIMNGVEMNDAGKHIAYYLQDAVLGWQRIEATNKTTGLTVAYLVGGLEYRLDYSRTFPLFSGLFEIVKSVERYTDATLQSAEEQNKNAFQLTSDVKGTGENPYVKNINLARGTQTDGTIPVDAQYKEMANTVLATTSKQLIHNYPGGKIEPLEKNEAELYFKDFRGDFFEMICAAVNAPPNVIRSKYDTSFSSARASIKDWEHTLLVDRKRFSFQFRKPIYEMWLHMEALKNKINLPQYFNLHAKNNIMGLAAYRNAVWIGDNVPHIDPVKEVMAERLKLGETGADIPLTTAESATQNVNGGDFRHNSQQYSSELKETKSLGIKQEPQPQLAAPNAAWQSILRFAENYQSS